VKAGLRLSKRLYVRTHGAWYVRYRQRILQEDGFRQAQPRLQAFRGVPADFSNIFEVKRCRASSCKPSIAIGSVHIRESADRHSLRELLPWTKEERRASTSEGHHEIWINTHPRSRRRATPAGISHVDASRMLRAIAKKKDLTKTTLQLSSRFEAPSSFYAKNEGAFDGTNPVDGG